MSASRSAVLPIRLYAYVLERAPTDEGAHPIAALTGGNSWLRTLLVVVTRLELEFVAQSVLGDLEWMIGIDNFGGRRIVVVIDW